jgi:hypothetical protein
MASCLDQELANWGRNLFFVRNGGTLALAVAPESLLDRTLAIAKETRKTLSHHLVAKEKT